MNSENLLTIIENEIILSGLQRGIVLYKRDFVVPLRPGKFKGTELENFLGRIFQHDCLLGINYFGYWKLSSEIIKAKKSVEDIFPNVRFIIAKAVFFASINTDCVMRVAPGRVAEYRKFKKHINKLRWKRKS